MPPRLTMYRSVLKLDIETFEWEVLPELWELCSSGKLVLDQLNVELHTLTSSPLLVRHVYAAFEGALACGLALHHKEMNTFTWHLPSLNRLAEFSWVSLTHAQRSVAERERSGQSSAGPSEAHQLTRQPSPFDSEEHIPRTCGPPIYRHNQWLRSGPRPVHSTPRRFQRRAAAWAAQGLVEDGRAPKSSVRVPARRNVKGAVPLPRDVPAPEEGGR